MADGWRSTEASESHKATKSPWSNNDDHEDDKKSLVERTGWGDNVSPLALGMKPVNNDVNNGEDPNRNGGNGQKPWRAGGTNVAPGAQNLPIDGNRQQNSPWKQNGAGFEAGSPDAPPAGNNWKAGYPDSTYKGPEAQQPSPWGQRPGADTPQTPPTPWNPNPGRATFPDSTYKGPDAPAPMPAPPADWRDFAQKQMQQQQQNPGGFQQPGYGPRPGEAPGNPGNPGLNGVTDDQRKFIDNSLVLKTSMQGYLATGAGTGALIGATEWALDRKLLATAGAPQTGIMGWWQNHSPILKEQAAFRDRLTGAEELHATRIAEQSLASEALSSSATRLKDLVAGLDSRVAADEALKSINLARTGTVLDAAQKAALQSQINALEPAQKLLLRQQEFIGSAANITNPAKIATVVGTETEVAAGSKLFVAGSAEATHLTEFARLSQSNSKAVSSIKAAEAELERSRAMLQESVDGGAGNLLGRSFKGAATGLAIAGGSLAAGYALDTGLSKMFGYKAPETDGMTRFMLDGVAVPAILMSNLPARYKFGLAGTAFASARVADYFAGTGAAVQMSSLLRPNIVDGIGITAAAMAPLDGKSKALAIAGAYALGRVYNGVARLTGLDGGRPEELRENATNSFMHDQLTRSEKSFDAAVDKAKTLGKENEAALELQMRDWLDKQSTTAPITHMRGTAIIAAGLGQFRLEEGSRFDLTSHADKKDRILKGANFDFGGEATTWLRMSAGSLASAQNFVIQNKGQVVEGQAMDDAYLQQLKNAQKKVEAQLDLIYGPHDVKAVFNELKNQARVNSGDMQQALVRMKGAYDVLSTRDTKFMAKSARDLTIGYLAEASYMASKGNGEEARTMYLAAVQYLQASQRLDPSAADNKALNDLQREVMQGAPSLNQQSIPKAIDTQWKSNFNNPFQLNTPQYPDMPRK